MIGNITIHKAQFVNKVFSSYLDWAQDCTGHLFYLVLSNDNLGCEVYKVLFPGTPERVMTSGPYYAGALKESGFDGNLYYAAFDQQGNITQSLAVPGWTRNPKLWP